MRRRESGVSKDSAIVSASGNWSKAVWVGDGASSCTERSVVEAADVDDVGVMCRARASVGVWLCIGLASWAVVAQSGSSGGIFGRKHDRGGVREDGVRRTGVQRDEATDVCVVDGASGALSVVVLSATSAFVCFILIGPGLGSTSPQSPRSNRSRSRSSKEAEGMQPDIKKPNQETVSEHCLRVRDNQQ